MSAKKTGLDALLTPEESVLLLIDHQPFQFAGLNSHEPTMVVNNVVGLAKTVKAFGIPTILTTVMEERGGNLIQGRRDRCLRRGLGRSTRHGRPAHGPGGRGADDLGRRAGRAAA